MNNIYYQKSVTFLVQLNKKNWVSTCIHLNKLKSNQREIKTYDVSTGLKPFVTLLHYDHPQSIEDAYGGFLSPKVV